MHKIKNIRNPLAIMPVVPSKDESNHYGLEFVVQEYLEIYPFPNTINNLDPLFLKRRKKISQLLSYQDNGNQLRSSIGF